MKKLSRLLRKNKAVVTALCLIVFTGFFLRVQGILTSSFAFTYDVGRDMLQVQQIVAAHKLPLIGQTSGLGGLYYGPSWYYILTPAFILSGGNPQGVAFFMVVMGVLTIVLGYILGVMVSGRALGLITASLLSISMVMIGFSSQIWNPNLAPFFVVLIFICLFRLQMVKRYKLLLNVAIGLLLGLILDSEIVFGLLFASGFVLSYLYVMKKKTISFLTLGVPVGFLIILAPRLLFELRHNFVMTRSLFMPHTSDQAIFDLGNFFVSIPDRGMTLFNQFSETLGFRNNLVVGIMVVFFISLLILLRKRFKKHEVQLLISSCIILLVFLVGSAFFARAVWGHYLVGLPVLYIFIISLALNLLYRKLRVLSLLILFIIFVINVQPVQLILSYTQPLWEGNAAVYRNQTSSLDYIYKDANGRHFNYIAYTPVVHDFTYQYLFSWYGKTKYGYTPDQKTQKLFYVIIEPDEGNEFRIVDWLKIREGDGKIVKEKTGKGGIRVQTRSR